ncbi:glycosyltransferase family protein [Pedobacter lusitanus]|uniref:glycosyltransferase family protein n=1 Tax=Pedobacter lusitanus TaxID=1503925 RepID=UPI000A79FBA4|nr:glycosyltransferase family protein [Pedobacter lusitanus]
MKILYAIQGTGNGHISRAREIVPLLQQHGDVELLISGTQADVKLSQQVAYQLHGFSFIFGKKGGVNHYETWKSMNLPRFVKDMRMLPLKNYNLILNDFEPVTAWACKLKGVESVGLSHQASFQSKKSPEAKKYRLGTAGDEILRAIHPLRGLSFQRIRRFYTYPGYSFRDQKSPDQ